MNETYLKRSLDSANEKAKYDENVKTILSDKTILSWILKYSAEEYRDCSIEEIRSCIEGTPLVAGIAIMPGSTRLNKVLGLNTENEIQNEGKVTFDIIFYALHPDTRERTKIFLNKEATAKLCNLSDWVEERGIEQSTELKLIQLTIKKLKKSDTIAQIANALEETAEKIGRIVEVAQMYALEYDERKSCTTI